jgi:hypothetical protein
MDVKQTFMGRLNPDKLHVSYLEGTTPEKLILPRCYTLTHSDATGDLFLSIGDEYNTRQISGLYTRLMRDEVLAELAGSGEQTEFKVYCHVSGGFVIGPARWRYDIFCSELPLVLEAIRYGDRTIFECNAKLDHVPVNIYFQSTSKRFNNGEQWGTMSKFIIHGY